MITRQQIYTIFIFISAAIVFGRIMAVDRIDLRGLEISRRVQIQKQLEEKEARLRQTDATEESIEAEMKKTREKLALHARLESPMLSGNDRSRWCTIRALVEPDMRVIRTVSNPDGSTRNEYVWYAIDKVQDIKGWDTIDMVKHALPDQPGREYLYSSKPPLLPTLMAIPYAVLYWAGSGRISLESEPYVVVRIMLVLLNLIPLVICWILSIHLIDRFGTTDWGRVFCAAFVCFGTFIPTFAVTLNNHLPAVFFVTVSTWFFVRIFFDDQRHPVYFLVSGLCAFLAVCCELPALSFCVFLGLLLLWRYTSRTLLFYLPAVLVAASGFFATNMVAHHTFRPAYSKPEWYQYEYERGGIVRDSYWKNPVGIDRGEPDRGRYILHATVGHHGLFLLTPVWLMSLWGCLLWLFGRGDIEDPSIPKRRITALLILALSVIVFGFYMIQAQPNRNYGGMSCALRWLFWLIPLWFLPLAEAADRMSLRPWSRALALCLLALSVMSMSYPVWNPWTLPWPYHLMYYYGWPVL